MYKRLLLISILTIIGLIIIYIITIPKIDKWHKQIINNYIIEKKNDTSIKLIKDKKIIVNDYIAEYSYGKRYILLKSITKDININFYIIDTKYDTIHGPYNDYETFIKVKEKIVDEEIGSWYKTIE